MMLWRVDATHECGELSKFFEHEHLASYWAGTLTGMGWSVDWYPTDLVVAGSIRDTLLSGLWPNAAEDELLALAGDPVFAARRTLDGILARQAANQR